MTEIVLVKDNDESLKGFTEKDGRAWARFRKIIKQLEIGELLCIEYWFERNRKFHAKHMKLIRTFLNAQEKFEDFDQFRYWLTIGAGWCDWVVGPKGAIVPIAKSLSFRSGPDDEQFAVVHENTKAFLRTEHPQKVMWPHLTPEQRSEMVETLLVSFERPQI